jgi:hypothetical protein
LSRQPIAEVQKETGRVLVLNNSVSYVQRLN